MRLRRDLIAGPHPTSDDVWLIFCTVTGRQFEIPPQGWQLLEMFDGRRTFAAVAEHSGASLPVVEAFAERLAQHGLLVPATTKLERPADEGASLAQWTRGPVPDHFDVEVHADARFECSGAGICCTSGYVIPLSSLQASAVRRAARRVLGPDVDPVGMLPTSPGQPWTFALDNEESCPFLGDDSSCRIHETKAYPSPCRIFPFVFARFEGRVFAGIAHRCVCGASNGGRSLSAQRSSIAARLRAAATVFTVPPTTRIDARTIVPSAGAIEALLDATHAPDAFAILTRAAANLAALTGSSGSRARPIASDRLYEALGRAAAPWNDAHVDAALAGRHHPDRRRIRAALRRASLWSPRGDSHAEATRFVRDHLFALRPYHYETLTAGLLAVGLAAHRILARLPRDAHPAARERVMLWEEALTTDALPRVLAEAPVARRITADATRTGRQLEALAVSP